jgi:hypothetical protein
MRTTKYSILVGYSKIIKKYGKNYSYATTSTMLDLLHDFTGVRISARAFYRHTSDLRKEGLLQAYRRYGRNENGTIYRRSSHVYITIKGYYLLAKTGIEWAWKMVTKLKRKYQPKKTDAAIVITPANKVEEKKEADTLKDIAHKVRCEGTSLYEYLLKRPQPLL